MLHNFQNMQKYGKDNVDATMNVWFRVSKGVQAMAAETADYTQKSFEQGTAALQKLLGAKSLENAIEIQTAYAKTVYQGFVAQAARMGDFYVNFASETFRPFENYVLQVQAAKHTGNFVHQASTAKPTKNFTAANPTKNFAPQAPVAQPTENFVPQASAAKPTEKFVPEASAVKPTEIFGRQNLAPKTPAPKTTTPKTAAPKVPAPKTSTPKTSTPKISTPKTAAPKVPAPKMSAPKTAVPKATAWTWRPLPLERP
jgi:hypothetical protein